MISLIKKLGLAVLLIATTSSSIASRYQYDFSGIISSFTSYNPNYSAEDLDVVLGVTPVSYVFDVDFSRNVYSFTNSAATWNYFFADLVGDGYAFSQLGGLPYEDQSGFNAEFVSWQNIGELDGGSSVRVFTSSFNTSNWKVADWQINQSFQFSDGTTVLGESGAIYVFGNVTLNSITVIPEPSSYSAIASVGVLVLAILRRKQKKH